MWYPIYLTFQTMPLSAIRIKNTESLLLVDKGVKIIMIKSDEADNTAQLREESGKS